MLAVAVVLLVAVPGNHDVTLTVGGVARTYVAHVPPRAAERGSLPVVLAFHGGGGTAAGYQAYTGLDALADREGFVVAYPDGSGALGRRLLTWNAGECCGYARDHDVDDVGFALGVLRDLAAALPIDATRVYATGHSNGAMMAYRLAVEAAPRVAAIAPVAGMMVTRGFAPARPVPLLHVHSVDDPRALYAGGLGPPFPFTRTRVAHRAVEPELARWVVRDGCPAAPREVERRTAPVGGGAAPHTATRLLWAPCAEGTEVQLWRLTGAGHGWPGSRAQLPERLIGPETAVIDAAAEVWRFLSRFRRPDAPALTGPRSSRSSRRAPRSRGSG